MKLDNNLKLQELELLSQAYLECKLTKTEEYELCLVLASTAISSPLIEEVRETMAACSLINMPASHRTIKRHLNSALIFTSIAACIAIAICMGINIMRFYTGNQHHRDIIVYVNGNQLDEDKARSTALETQATCMQMLDRVVNDARVTQMQSMNIINSNIKTQ